MISTSHLASTMEDPSNLSKLYSSNDEEILSLCLFIKLLPDTSSLENFLLTLEQTDEDHHISMQMIEVAKTRSKCHHDSHIHPGNFNGGGLVLFYDQSHDKSRK